VSARKATKLAIDGVVEREVAVKPLQCSVEHLRRVYLPVDTMELAQYLIGKTLIHA